MSGTYPSGSVAFDPVYFAARYPEFNAVSSTLLGYYFNEAGVILGNTGSSIVADGTVGGRRYTLLHLLTAHVAQLNSGSSAQPLSPLVGRIASAGQGSVSVSTDMGAQPASASYYMQTRYGAQFWTMTQDLRAGGVYAGYVRDARCGSYFA